MVLGNTSHYVNDLMGIAIKYSIPIVIVDPYADRGKRCEPSGHSLYGGMWTRNDFIIIDGIYLL